jgi:hypothetical protein
MKTIVVVFVLALLAGCAVVPAAPYYAPGPYVPYGYYTPPVYGYYGYGYYGSPYYGYYGGRGYGYGGYYGGRGRGYYGRGYRR